jgi:hypothetical protein
MKKVLLALLATMGASLSVMAQDVIVLLNAEEVQAKVKSIGLQDVVYLKWNNLNGPTYTLPKSDILFIKYANGQKETFLNQAKVASTTYSTKTKMVKEDFSKVKFQGYTYLGADFNSVFGGPSLDFSFGARTSKYLYVGGGIGWHNLLGHVSGYYYNDYYYNDYYDFTIWMPYLTFTTDLKAYIPTRGDFYPRLDLSFGGTVDAMDAYAGLYLSFGAGFDYRRLSFGIGYQMPVYADLIMPLGYVRLGIRLGKR